MDSNLNLTSGSAKSGTYSSLVKANHLTLAGFAWDLVKLHKAQRDYVSILENEAGSMLTALKSEGLEEADSKERYLKDEQVKFYNVVTNLGKPKGIDYSKSIIAGLENLTGVHIYTDQEAVDPYCTLESKYKAALDEIKALKVSYDAALKELNEQESETPGDESSEIAELKNLLNLAREESAKAAKKLVDLQSIMKSTSTAAVKATAPFGAFITSPTISNIFGAPLPTASPVTAIAHGNHKGVKLGPNIPTLNGHDTNQKVIDWLFIIEQTFVLQKVPDNLKISSILSFVKGSFFEIARKHIESNDLNWVKFRETLLIKTDSKEINFNLKTKLFSLKQDGTFEKFLAEFEYLTNKISDLTEDQKLDLFLRCKNKN